MRCQEHINASVKMHARAKMHTISGRKQFSWCVDCFEKGFGVLVIPRPKGKFVTTHFQNNSMLLHPGLAKNQ